MAKYLAHWEVGAVGGPVVAIDVIRAFTTAAYAFSAGAREIHLTETLAETYALLDANPTWLAMGEEHGRRPDRFALSNSPAHAAAADLDGRTIVQRTSAGTRGALAARRADPLLCASLVVASATAAYLNTRTPGRDATYLITGRFADAPHATGDEDLATAEYIELLRQQATQPGDADEAIRRVLSSPDAASTIALGPAHVHSDDLRYCTAVDHFDFAMVATRTSDGLTLRATKP